MALGTYGSRMRAEGMAKKGTGLSRRHKATEKIRCSYGSLLAFERTANRNHGRGVSPSGPKLQARMRRCGEKHSLTKSRGTRRNLPQGRSGAEKVEGGEWPRMIGGLTSVSAQVSGANAPSQGEWASRPHRTSLVGGTPTLLEGARRHDALPLIWVVSAKQPYHFFLWVRTPYPLEALTAHRPPSPIMW
jgi:hypothetical protein